VFVDANTLVYYFEPHPLHGPACQQFVQRIEQQQLVGITSTHVLGEMAHRLMTLEAAARAGWSGGKVVQRLKQHPSVVTSLSGFQTAVDQVLQSRFQVLSVTAALLSAAVQLSRQFGLLINDALIVALMQRHGVTDLASHDTDFDRVPGIARYAPA
jgi:predicted nucleic acid-binding protein